MKKEDHEAERKQTKVNGRIKGEKIKGRNDVIIL